MTLIHKVDSLTGEGIYGVTFLVSDAKGNPIGTYQSDNEGYDSVYEDQELSHRAKAVYIYLKDHADRQGACWPGIRTIAAGLNLSRSTVKRALGGRMAA